MSRRTKRGRYFTLAIFQLWNTSVFFVIGQDSEPLIIEETQEEAQVEAQEEIQEETQEETQEESQVETQEESQVETQEESQVEIMETIYDTDDGEETRIDNFDTESTDTQPTDTESTDTQPTDTESTEPESTEPESTEPESTEPESTEPESTEPESTEPESTEPESTEIESTEPESTEPESTEPESTEPESTEPESTEPESTEIESTEPESTEPESTEPESTEPESTEYQTGNIATGNIATSNVGIGTKTITLYDTEQGVEIRTEESIESYEIFSPSIGCMNSPTYEVVINSSYDVGKNNGKIQEDTCIVGSNEDVLVTIDLPKGVILQDKDGQRVEQLLDPIMFDLAPTHSGNSISSLAYTNSGSVLYFQKNNSNIHIEVTILFLHQSMDPDTKLSILTSEDGNIWSTKQSGYIQQENEYSTIQFTVSDLAYISLSKSEEESDDTDTLSPVSFVDHTNKTIEGNITVSTKANQKQQIDLYLTNSVIQHIFLDDVVDTGTPAPFRVHEFSSDSLLPGSVQMYSFDPEAVDFAQGEMTVIAKGDTLEKCVDRDFTTQTCLGTWDILLTDLTIGQPYTFSISPKDPGFKETVSACAANNRGSINTFPDACDATNGSNLTLNDGNTETHDFNHQTFAGVRIQSVNTSILDCASISGVSICYEWWANTTAVVDCDISVDANAGASYSTVTTTCPGTSANPGVTCTDVTSLETRTCANFFGPTGTRAYAKSQNSRNGGGQADTTTRDVFYYDVVYTITTPNNPPTDITLSGSSIDENVATGSLVGTLTTTDADVLDTHTYTLVSGTGSTDNSSFSISGSQLNIELSPDYESQTGYSIRLQTDDGNGGTYQEIFTITVNDLAECGNDVIESGETCDDGNTDNGDGCSSTCTIESGYICKDETLCGNGTIDDGEQCDDSNTLDGDGCSEYCIDEYNFLISDFTQEFHVPDGGAGGGGGLGTGDVIIGVSGYNMTVPDTFNPYPMTFYSPYNFWDLSAPRAVELGFSGAVDDDYIGYVFGRQPGDRENPDSDYILVMRKDLDQFFDYTDTAISGGTATAGLSVARVQGVIALDELWQIQDDALTTGTITLLATGTTYGATGYRPDLYDTSVFYNTGSLEVLVEGVVDISITGNFVDGRFGAFVFAQQGNTFTLSKPHPYSLAVQCFAECGDSTITGTETCDDGNTTNGDGCSEFCATEEPDECALSTDDCNALEVCYNSYEGWDCVCEIDDCTVTTTGDICIYSPTSFNFSGNIYSEYVETVFEQQFTGSFQVEDSKGLDSGWYTTLQMGNLSGVTYGDTLSNANIEWYSTGITLLSGDANSDVVLATGWSSYRTADSVYTFILRDPGANSGRTGTYGTFPRLRLTLPAYTKPDIYQAEITYTLFEN